MFHLLYGTSKPDERLHPLLRCCELVPSDAHERFSKNLEDIDRLLEIHTEIGGGKPGRRNAEVLNKSGVVLITAMWEAYCEDVCQEALTFLMSTVDEPAQVPGRVQAIVAQRIAKDAPIDDPRKVWRLAGNGWKNELQHSMDVILEETIQNWNTPMSENVRRLFKDALGIARIDAVWTWQGMTSLRAREKLDEYVDARHDIAHRHTTEYSVYRGWVEDFQNHVERLADATDVRVAEHLVTITGKVPWETET